MNAAASDHTPPNAGPAPSSARPAWGSAAGLLGLAVLATAVGTVATTFRGDGTALNAYLFMELGLPHVTAGRLERGAAALTLMATAGALVFFRWPWFLPAAGYIFAEAIARWHVQGQAYSEWAPLTHSARYAAPLVLALWLVAARRQPEAATRWQSIGAWLLRFALAAVFVSHGLEALQGHPGFVDLILSSALNLGGWRLTEGTATAALEWIGVADFAAAGALILRPHPAVLAWAAFWAALTACSRLTANGWGAYPDVLLRAAYFLGPLALWRLQHHAPAKAGQDATRPFRPISPDSDPGSHERERVEP